MQQRILAACCAFEVLLGVTLLEKKNSTQTKQHKQIRAYTPRHNGKVERSHRKDNERFYSKRSFYSLADLQEQLKLYNREYNQTPMRPLGWKSPNQYLADYFNNKNVTDV